MRTREAAEFWHVSLKVARRWYREAGVQAVRKEAERPVKLVADSPSQICACLNCDRPPERCTGNCALIESLRERKRQRKKTGKAAGIDGMRGTDGMRGKQGTVDER